MERKKKYLGDEKRPAPIPALECPPKKTKWPAQEKDHFTFPTRANSCLRVSVAFSWRHLLFSEIRSIMSLFFFTGTNKKEGRKSN